MKVGLLGPFEVSDDGGALVEVPGTRLRALMAALALEPGRVVTRSRLVDWIWGQEPPADEANAVQALVSRLRKVVPGGVLEAKAGGYRLAVEADAVDVSRFERLVGEARAAQPAMRGDLLHSALDLWRGSALEGIDLRGSDAFDAAVARLDEQYLGALGDRIDADIRLGRGAELISELSNHSKIIKEDFRAIAAAVRETAAAAHGR